MVYPLYFRYQQPWVQTPFNLDCLFFFSHDGLLLPSFHARSYLLLTAARASISVQKWTCTTSKCTTHVIVIRADVPALVHLPSALCRSLPLHVLCPSGLFLDMAPRSRAIHPLVQRLGPSQCPASASDIPLSARGSALHCSIGDIFKTQRAIPYQPGYGRGYSRKPLTQSREPMASRGRPGQHEGISS